MYLWISWHVPWTEQFPMLPRCPSEWDYMAGDRRRPDWAVGPLGPYSSRPAQSSSSYPRCITRAITAFIKKYIATVSVCMTYFKIGQNVACRKGLVVRGSNILFLDRFTLHFIKHEWRTFQKWLASVFLLPIGVGVGSQTAAFACHQSVAWITSDFNGFSLATGDAKVW